MKTSSPNSPARVFDWAAQAQFSQLSGDRNPMHMDVVAARRTHAGQPVVHGMHAVLWALESIAGKGDIQFPIAQIKVRFQKLIYVGDEVKLEFIRHDIAGISLQLSVDSLPVSSITIGFGEGLRRRAVGWHLLKISKHQRTPFPDCRRPLDHVEFLLLLVCHDS